MQEATIERVTWDERARELRRARVVLAMAQLAAERGFGGVSLAALCASAEVSRTRFYELFDGLEACFLAVLDEGYRHASAAILRASGQAGDWLEGIRLGLAELLLFFDAAPQLARVCLVESLAAGPWALRARDRHVANLMRLILTGWETRAPPEPYQFINDGIAASVLGVVQNRMQLGDKEPLVSLLGSLVGLASSPYLDFDRVAEEVRLGEELAGVLLAERGEVADHGGVRTMQAVPDLLLNPKAHRVRETVVYLAKCPGASNREIARAIGVASYPQISRLLTRLAATGLAVKRASMPGRPNAWSLTAHGAKVADTLGD